MTGISYNSPTCYANLGFDNWPSQNPAAPVNGVKAMLLTSAYTPNVLADAKYADISGSESSATGYSAGGVAVTLSNTMDVTNKDVIAAANPLWTLTGPTSLACRYVAFYINATIKTIVKPLISYTDLGQTYTTAPTGGHTSSFGVIENGGVTTALTVAAPKAPASKPKAAPAITKKATGRKVA